MDYIHNMDVIIGFIIGFAITTTELGPVMLMDPIGYRPYR